MAKKFYVVWQGRETGIFTDWNTCKKQVDKFAGAKYKSFMTIEEAESAFNGGGVASSGKASNDKPFSKTPATRKKASTQEVKTYTAAEISAMSIDTKIFTDGGCDPNPGKAGSGLAVYRKGVVDELWYGLYNPKGTNNTAELNALHQALLMAKDEISNGNSVAIFCDSKYAIQCVTQWAVAWEKNGWRKKTGDIKNLALIKEMFSLHQSLKEKIQVLHVNGHVGLEGNELADRMSMVAIRYREVAFVRFQEPFDVAAILAMQHG